MKEKWTAHLVTIAGILILGFLGLACVTTSVPESEIRKKITKAADSASAELKKRLPKTGKIAVISSDSNPNGNYAVEDVEYNLINSRYALVDRQQLASIRAEQRFQLSGDVSDESAVQIGRMAGAVTVVVVNISSTSKYSGYLVNDERVVTDYSGRIILKALNVQTAEIIAIARGNF
jgi:hypothetical protein